MRLHRLAQFVGLWLLAATTPLCGAEPSPPEVHVNLQTFLREFVEITPGEAQFPAEFTFGDDRDPDALPAQVVRLSEPFSIQRYEVWQDLYAGVMGNNPSRWRGPRNAVDSVTFAEAEEFCRRATALLRADGLLGAQEVIRLPMETEWEYCCRAGTATTYGFGDAAQRPGDQAPHASVLDRFGWHHGNAAGNDPQVGALLPNAWGLYDMHGYLWEYCRDAAQPQATIALLDEPNAAASPAGDPTAGDHPAGGPTAAAAKDALELHCVLRGGSWKAAFTQCRSTSRRQAGQQERDDAFGFRCVRSRE